MKATSFSSSISANLGNSQRTNGRNSQVFSQRNLWPPHFRTFCELVEGEENTNYIFHMDYNVRV